MRKHTPLRRRTQRDCLGFHLALSHQKSYPAVRCPGAIPSWKLFVSAARPQKSRPLFPGNHQSASTHA